MAHSVLISVLFIGWDGPPPALISNALYQEVQFTVECMPRTWFEEQLLREPIQVRSQGETGRGPMEEVGPNRHRSRCIGRCVIFL